MSAMTPLLVLAPSVVMDEVPRRAVDDFAEAIVPIASPTARARRRTVAQAAGPARSAIREAMRL